jgi:dicarboxylate transporter DctA-like protein
MYRARPVKYSKTIMITAGVAVTLVLVVWFMRNTLVQRMSNPLLQDYGIAVTDVSLDALTTNDATIGYLELVHENGTTISIEGLTLPISTASTGLKAYSAERITIISATRAESEPFELARLVDQLLSMPSRLGQTGIFVAELSVPPYPEIHDLRVLLQDSELEMQATIGTVTVSAAITQTGTSSPVIVFTLPDESPDAPEQSISAKMQRSAQSISLSGFASLDLPAWEPLGKLAGMLPQEIALRSGSAEMRFDIGIPYDTRQPVSMTAELTPTGPLQFTYADDGGETTAIKVKSGSPVHLTASFPEVEWSLSQAQTSLTVSIDEWLDIPLSIADLSCESGPSCSMHTNIEMQAAALAFGKADHIALSSAQKLEFPDEGLHIDVQPGATLDITGLSTFDTNVAGISAKLVSAATLELVDAGWRLSADSLDAEIEALSLFGNFGVKAQHNLDSGAGQLSISDASASFDARSLSSRVSPWGEDWDITAGNLALELQANWTQSGADLKFDGQSSLRLQDLAGHYGDTAFVGLSTSLETAYGSEKGFTAKPSSVTVDLIEMGLPIENISASYTLYPNEMALDMADLRMEAFGGVMRADPFSFRTASNINTVLMRAEAIQLSRLLTLDEFEAIEVSGTVGAELPVTIVGDSLTITQGRLFGEPPGGVIRYRPGSEPDETDASGIGFVTLALSNFKYETLTSEIDYNAAGDLKLKLRLTGRNPDLDTNRPVVLNLGVENNVPQMLKSLRAARTVEDILEQRLQ